MSDKYSAVWVSHSSISDFKRCPRAYFLKNVFRDPKTRHKMKLMSPSLALGSTVHEVLESLSVLPSQRRFSESLIAKYERAWEKVKGKRGGFPDEATEYLYRERGAEMLRRVTRAPGPLANKAVKINMDLPNFWLSEEEGLVLCGRIDWLEFFEEPATVHIIDFKTGKGEENSDSLQLPIYFLLASNCQKWPVAKASYWYLETSDEPIERPLPSAEEAMNRVLEAGREIKIARQLNRFKCPGGEEGCPACRPFEAISRGEAEFVGSDEYRNDIFILPREEEEDREGVIL